MKLKEGMKRVERIPELLKKRLAALKGTDYEMSPEVFDRATSAQAIFDRVLLWQVPEGWYGGDEYEGTGIVKATSTKIRHQQDTPRGIIISAGLNALDVLASHGVGIGHVVHFCVNSMYRRPLDDHDEKHLALMRVGDNVDSEDLAAAIDNGTCHVVLYEGKHILVDNDGNQWEPQLPWIES
jgi:hypothetical protein